MSKSSYQVIGGAVGVEVVRLPGLRVDPPPEASPKHRLALRVQKQHQVDSRGAQKLVWVVWGLGHGLGQRARVVKPRE
jgi:hypothetical protein